MMCSDLQTERQAMILDFLCVTEKPITKVSLIGKLKCLTDLLADGNLVVN